MIINIIDLAYRYFERPYLLLLIIPLIIGLWFLIKKDFIKVTDEVRRNKVKKTRLIVFISRAVIILLLIIALSNPFIEKTKTIAGDPKIKILVDNSSSMQLYNLDVANRLRIELEKKIPTEIEYINSKDKSPIADSLISNMRKNENILLISDGNNNVGTELGDAVLRARTLNATINSIELKPKNYDSSISIEGSDKTISGIENTFKIRLQQTENKKVRVIVNVDGQEIINTITDKDLELKRIFTDGYHRITAKVENNDYFPQNSIYYKTVKVVPKPKVLIFGNEINDVQQLFNPVYDTIAVTTLPEDLNEYTALVINNLDAENLNDKTSQISDFVAEGNGLYVIGGGNSFDSGNFKGSKFEQILPAYVAKAGRKRGEVNIIFVIDISGSTGHQFGNSIKVDVEKSLALDMIQNLSLINNVGAVAFNTVSYKISDIKSLVENKNYLLETISRLKNDGSTNMGQGLGAAIEMLEGRGGSKNIILISDGRNQDTREAENAAATAGSKGIRIYTVGVGEDTYTENMQYIADITSGTYFEPSYTDRIKVLFGETETAGDKKVFPLVVVDNNHFITKGLKTKASLYGFNQIVPNSNGKMLVSTDTGDPILVVGRLGLGRIALLATDYKLYGFELLSKDNSLLSTRTMNWIIGDPERKNENYINIPDTRIGEGAEITIRSSEQPVSDEVAFYKVDEKLYQGSLDVKKSGFNSILNAIFAVNYNSEYQDIEVNPELQNVVTITGGKTFKEEQVNEIVEHIKLRSRREELRRISYSWIFAMIALIIYLGEVSYRRLIRNKNL